MALKEEKLIGVDAADYLSALKEAGFSKEEAYKDFEDNFGKKVDDVLMEDLVLPLYQEKKKSSFLSPPSVEERFPSDRFVSKRKIVPLKKSKGEPVLVPNLPEEKEILDIAERADESIRFPIAKEIKSLFGYEEDPNVRKASLEIGPSVAKIGGALKGLGEEAVQSVADLAKGVAFVSGVPSDSPLVQPSSKTAKTIESFSEEIAKGQKEKEKEGTLSRAAQVPLTIGKEAAHLVVDLANVVNELLGMTAKTPEEQKKGRFQKGEEIGSDFVASAIGVPVAAVQNLFDQPLATMEEKPVATIVSLLPIAEALGMKPASALGKAGKSWLQKYEATRKALEVAERPIGKAKQIVSDPYASRESQASAMMEETFKGSEAERDLAKASVSSLSKEIPETTIEKPRIRRKEEAFVEEELPIPQSSINEIEHLQSLKEQILSNPRLKIDNNLIYSLGRPVVDRIPINEVSRKVKERTESIRREIDDLERKIEDAEALDDLSEAGKLSDLVDEKSALIENDALPLRRQIAKEVISESIDQRIQELQKKRTVRKMKEDVLPSDIIQQLDVPGFEKPVSIRRDVLEGEIPESARSLNKELKTVLQKAKTLQHELFESFPESETLIDELGDRWVQSFEQYHLRNVDAPKAYLRALVEDDLQIKEIFEPKQKDLDLLADIVEKEYQARELQNRIDEKLSKTIRPPATSIDIFVLDEKGRLQKNLFPAFKEAIESVSGDMPHDVSKELRSALRIEREQLLGKSYVPRERESFLTGNPKWESWLDKIHESVLDLYGKGDEKILSKERIASRFAEVLKDGAASVLLHSKEFRKKIVNDILSRFKMNNLPKPNKSEIQKILEEIPDRLNAKRRLFQIVAKDGKIVYDLEEAIPRLLQDLPRKKKEELSSQTILAIGEELAEEIEFHSLRNAMKKESQRFINERTIANPFEWVKNVLSRMIENNEMPPLFSPFEGKKIGDILRDPNLRDLVATSLKKDHPNVSMEVIDSLIEGQEKRFSSMEKIDVSLLEKAYPEPSKQFKKTIPSEEPISNLYSIPEIASAFKWELESRAALRHPTKMMGFFSALKRNLVARGFSSLVNNNISNYFLQSLRTGNPLIFVDILRDGFIDWKRWRKDPKSIDPKKAEAYAAIERSGLIDVTELSRDIGKTPDVWYNKLGDLSVIGSLNRSLEWAYSNLGDIPFKVHEATTKYLQARKAIEEMDFGRSIFMDIGKNVQLQVQKLPGNQLSISFLDRKGNVLPGKSAKGTIDSPKVSQALGRASAYEANKIFFDYSDIGLWGKVIRSTPFLNAMSGFYTWYLKSLDIPFLKRGLFAEALFPLDFIRSNDPKIQQKQIISSSLLQARKALILSGMTERTKENGIEDVKRISAFAPKYGNMIILSSILDPTNVYFRELSTTYPFKSLDTLLRVGSGAFVERFLSPDDIKKIFENPNENKLVIKELSGEIWSKGDILELFGIGGNALVDFWSELRKDDEWGTKKDISNLAWERLGPALIGRTAFNAISAGLIGGIGEAIGKGEEVSDLSGYGKEQRKLGFLRGSMGPESSGYASYLIRALAGIGWRKINLVQDSEHPVSGTFLASRYQKYIVNVEKELKAAILKSVKEKGERIRMRIDASSSKEEAALLRKELSNLQKVHDELKFLVEDFVISEETRIGDFLEKGKK